MPVGTTVTARPDRRTSAPAASMPAARLVAGLVAGLAVACIASLLIGSRMVTPSAVWDASHPDHAIVAARLARTLLALAVGAALGLSGAVLQGLTRNPLADPGILGINAGAAFAMVLAMSVLGRVRAVGVPGGRLRGGGQSRPSRCTWSRRSGATARPR